MLFNLVQHLTKVGEFFWPVLFTRAVEVDHKHFHAVETCFVERFEDVERGKDERARAAGGVEHGDGGDALPECHEQVRVFAVLDDILRELAEVEIEGDEVVDLFDFASGESLSDFLVVLAAGNDFPPRFGGQGDILLRRVYSSHRAWKYP